MCCVESLSNYELPPCCPQLGQILTDQTGIMLLNEVILKWVRVKEGGSSARCVIEDENDSNTMTEGHEMTG